MEKSPFRKMVDKMCQLHPECEDYHETRVTLCKEFLETVKKMQGTDLEPYLAEVKCTPYDGCYNMTFKFPLVPYSELKNLQ